VFGLGAILCEILTGQPPYVADAGTQIYRLASRGKLDACLERLDGCGADTDLIAIAKKCVEVEPADRPRDAGALAEQVTAYLESVETKLRETEIERAAQAARAIEERKRRKVTLALAVSILLTFGLGGGGWVWMQQQQAARRAAATAQVDDAMGEARLHRGLANNSDLDARLQELEIAVGDAEQAVKLAEQDEVDTETRQNATVLLAQLQKEAVTVRQQALQAAADRRFRKELDDIRLRQADGGLSFDRASAESRYAEAFRKHGLDVLTLKPEEAAQRIRDSNIREDMIAALDNWAQSSASSWKEDFQAFRLARQWKGAVEIGLRIIEQNPNDSSMWVPVAAVFVLAGDEAAYDEFSKRIVQQSGAVQDDVQFEQAWMARLVRPEAVDVAKIPKDRINGLLAQEGRLDSLPD
jgi:tetratricopeptide (TPR) repeat protein